MTSTPLSLKMASPLTGVMHRAWQALESNDPNGGGEAVRVLRDGLRSARHCFSDDDEWCKTITHHIRTHPAMNAVHEDPFISRSYLKPRGYAGDAVMLDFIYHHPANQPLLERTTPRGRASAGFSTNTPAPSAVRNRALLLAREIDEVCKRVSDAEILSVACGHLREVQHSHAIQSHSFGRLIAMDQDEASLDVVRADAGPLGVEARQGTVKQLIARRGSLGRFDFIYAAGLYDYLNNKVAGRLLRSMFDMLKPGGKVWIANFMPDIPDRAFMEALMDWWLIYRTSEEMLELARALAPGEYSSLRTFVEPDNNIVFLEVCR